MLDVAKLFQVETDSSNFATGGILSQQDKEGKWHPCTYLSQSMIPAERNYDIHDKELLAIIRALEEWRHYLEGAPHQIDIHTDHKNLAYFRDARQLNCRQARWALYLSRFDFAIIHKPGKEMNAPDALSRRPDHDPGDGDNQNVTLLPDQLFQIRQTSPDHRETTLNSLLIDRIRNSTLIDDDVLVNMETVLSKGPNQAIRKLPDWKIKDGLVLYKRKIYVPKDDILRRDVVQDHHDSKVTGHPGRYKTLELVQQTFWWPGINSFIRNYVDGCAVCQHTRILTHRPKIPGQPITHAHNLLPFEVVSMDFIGELPNSNGRNAIFVVVDQGCTKTTVFVSCTTKTLAEDTADLYLCHVWKRFGLPKRSISDRGPQFAVKVTQELCRKLGIQQNLSTAYHPQIDSETERVNQELEQYIRSFCNCRQNNWSDLLSTAKFAHNIRHHSAINQSPFNALMGFKP